MEQNKDVVSNESSTHEIRLNETVVSSSQTQVSSTPCETAIPGVQMEEPTPTNRSDEPQVSLNAADNIENKNAFQ